MVAGVARAAPSLASLDLAPDNLPTHSAWDLSAIPGLVPLAHSVGATLRKLRVPLQHGFPAGAVEALRGCSALEELELAFLPKFRPDNVVSAVEQLPALSKLRSLSMSTLSRGVGDQPSEEQVDEWDAIPLPANALAGLSALTNLRELGVTIGTEGANVSAAVSGLRSLCDLYVCSDLHVEHLAGLTNLTRLHADRILVPEGPPPAHHSATAGGGSRDSAPAEPPSSGNRWPLPPRLYKLWVEDKQPLAHLARLAAPESLLRVRLEPEWELAISMVNKLTLTEEDTVEDSHALRPDIVAAFPGAVELMKGRLKSERLLIQYTGDDCLRPADPRLGHSPWLAALAPLALRGLWLEGVMLDAADVHTMAGQLGTVEELSLTYCSLPLSSLPALSRMPRLRHLLMRVVGHWEEVSLRHEAAGAIVTLLQAAPGLERLSLSAPDEEACAAMREPVRAQLARLGRSARGVSIGGEALEQDG